MKKLIAVLIALSLLLSLEAGMTDYGALAELGDVEQARQEWETLRADAVRILADFVERMRSAGLYMPADPDAQRPAGGEAEGESREYRVIVSDRDGNPVEGAMIQLCDDTTCAFQPTDAEGVAAFAVEAQKAYEVHVLVAPEGYAPDENTYQTQDSYSDLSIVLEKARD